MSSIRHRSGGGGVGGDDNHGPETGNDGKTAGVRGVGGPARRNRRLHVQVWSRVVAIVGCYCAAVFILSQVGKDGGHRTLSVRKGSQSEPTTTSLTPRFVTVVMPSVVNAGGQTKRLENIARTWGPSSRAIYVVHSAEEYPEGKGRVVESGVPHGGGGGGNGGPSFPRLLMVPESIPPDKGVQRLQHVVRTIRGGIDPDFAFFVNDHTFVIPEHLCSYLSRRDPDTDLYAGHALKGSKEVAFNSGAAGYILSRKTMDKLIKKWDEKNETCTAEHASKWIQGNPGLVSAQCLDLAIGTHVFDTRDAVTHAHRFHAFGLVRTVTGKVDQWYLDKHQKLDEVMGVDAEHHHAPLSGAACCTPDTISFHYVEAAENLALDETRKRLASKPDMTDEELRAVMLELWPKEKKAIGYYAHGLPPGEDITEVWKDLLEVVRKITTGGVFGGSRGDEPAC